MKSFLYKYAYRVVSWFSDRSGGWAFLVRWKVALAALVIGVSTAAITSCKPMCYDQPGEEVMCYDPAPTCYKTSEEPCPEGEDGGEEENSASFPQADADM